MGLRNWHWWVQHVSGPIGGRRSNQTTALKKLEQELPQLPQPGEKFERDGFLLEGGPIEGRTQTVVVYALYPHSGWHVMGTLVFVRNMFARIIWPVPE